MASNLRVKIDRHRGRGAQDSAFYGIHLENAQACNGRGINVLLSLSYEDICALHTATRAIVTREADAALTVAAQPGSVRHFKEIPIEATDASRKKQFVKKEDIK